MQSVYLLALLVYVPIWVYFYIKGSSKNKEEMIFMSVLVAIFSPIASYLWWNRDWWVPPSIITGFPVIPEDILLGFLFGGISAVIYELCFYKKIARGAVPHVKSFWFLLFLMLAMCATLFSIFKFNSFNSIVVSMIFVAGSFFYVRKDLISSSIASGFLTLLISLPFYAVIHLISPEWALMTYKYELLSGLTIYNFPIEEFIYWFFYGLMVGPAYEYIKGWKLR